MAANPNSIFYKIGQSVKQQVQTGTADLSNKADLTGADFTGDLSGTNLTLSGNLKVLGETTQTKITEENLDIKDNLIGLNRGASVAANNSKDIGLYFERGSSESAGAILFDEANDKFVVGFLESAGAAGYNVDVSTTDGLVDLTVSGSIMDAILALPSDGKIYDVSFSNDPNANSQGLALPQTQVEIYIDHPTISADVTNGFGTWMDGFSDEAALISAINDLDFSGADANSTGTIRITVVVGTDPWDADHSYVAKYADMNTGDEFSMSVAADASAISAYNDTNINISSVSGDEVAGGAADASADNASAAAAPLKVGSLEIGADTVGDFADFEAGLQA